MGSSDKDAEVAREKLSALLVEYGLTWNDLPRILAVDIAIAGDANNAGTGAAAPAATPTEDDIPSLLGYVLMLIEEHIGTTGSKPCALARAGLPVLSPRWGCDRRIDRRFDIGHAAVATVPGSRTRRRGCLRQGYGTA
jgi:hypothetical protein